VRTLPGEEDEAVSSLSALMNHTSSLAVLMCVGVMLVDDSPTELPLDNMSCTCNVNVAHWWHGLVLPLMHSFQQML